MTALRLLHLNIENTKHLSLVLPFLQKQAPEVTCIQEIYQGNLEEFENVLGAKSFFVPMHTKGADTEGVAIFSKLPIIKAYDLWFGGSKEKLPEIDETTFATEYKTIRFSLAVCEIEKEGTVFKIGTAHFPVTVRGNVTDYQQEATKNFLAQAKELKEFVITADFNAPRGGEIFSAIAKEYKDNIPPQYVTSIDASLHRNGKKNPEQLADKMVDGIFSTPEYTVENITMISGVSDHCALVAEVIKS